MRGDFCAGKDGSQSRDGRHPIEIASRTQSLAIILNNLNHAVSALTKSFGEKWNVNSKRDFVGKRIFSLYWPFTRFLRAGRCPRSIPPFDGISLHSCLGLRSVSSRVFVPSLFLGSSLDSRSTFCHKKELRPLGLVLLTPETGSKQN